MSVYQLEAMVGHGANGGTWWEAATQLEQTGGCMLLKPTPLCLVHLWKRADPRILVETC